MVDNIIDGVDMVMRMDVISQLGGVIIKGVW